MGIMMGTDVREMTKDNGTKIIMDGQMRDSTRMITKEHSHD